MAHIDPATRELEFLGAGHDAVILKSSGEKLVLSSTGLLLGVKPDAVVEVSRLLEAGDIVLFATDGVTEAEAPNHILFGRDRMLEILQQCPDCTAREMTDRLYNAIGNYSQKGRQLDDVTIVVIRVLSVHSTVR